MDTPYKGLEQRAYWAPSVGQRNMFDISDLWRPAFPITPEAQIVTFGSCFAQHFSRALVRRNFNWVNKEPAPDGLSPNDAQLFNYGIFSARTANIYTATLLLQWVRWALGQAVPPDEVWEENGRFFDPFRPVIEPDGFATRGEVIRARTACIDAFRRCITEPDLFVFTLGLTESWWHGQDMAHEYPMCPGTAAGRFDPDRHVFVNLDYNMVLRALKEALALMRTANPRLRVLLTVSPVPLTATNSGNHVLVATMESKSILRAAAGAIARRYKFVDYFPSYEIINSAPYRATFFEPNLRGVNANGVNHVMRSFFEGLGLQGQAPGGPAADTRAQDADIACEEELLAAFAAGGAAR